MFPARQDQRFEDPEILHEGIIYQSLSPQPGIGSPDLVKMKPSHLTIWGSPAIGDDKIYLQMPLKPKQAAEMVRIGQAVIQVSFLLEAADMLHRIIGRFVSNNPVRPSDRLWHEHGMQKPCYNKTQLPTASK